MSNPAPLKCSCMACGAKMPYKPSMVCAKCASTMTLHFRMQCPACRSGVIATPGPLLSIELTCGHTLTPVADVGWIVESSIKSKLAISEKAG